MAEMKKSAQVSLFFWFDFSKLDYIDSSHGYHFSTLIFLFFLCLSFAFIYFSSLQAKRPRTLSPETSRSTRSRTKRQPSPAPPPNKSLKKGKQRAPSPTPSASEDEEEAVAAAEEVRRERPEGPRRHDALGVRAQRLRRLRVSRDGLRRGFRQRGHGLLARSVEPSWRRARGVYQISQGVSHMCICA